MHYIFMTYRVESWIIFKLGICILVERDLFIKKVLELFAKIESYGLLGNYPSLLRGCRDFVVIFFVNY